MPFTQRNDNTRVQKPLIVQPIKRKLVRRVKNEEVKQDNRPQIIRQQAQSRSDAQYKQDKMQKAQNFTIQAMLRPFVMADPSHLVGVAKSDKPFIETIGNPEVQATSNEIANFLIGSMTPSGTLKAITAPALWFKLSKGALTKKELISMGATQAEANWIFKELPLLKVGKSNQNKLNAILDKVAGGMKGKRGANAEIEAARQFDEVTDAQKLAKIRKQFQSQIDQVNAESKRGVLQLDWMDTNGMNQLGGMPDWLKLQNVGFDKQHNFLERYLSNVVSKVGPKQKELLNKGWLRPTKDGKHWEGLVEGGYVQVDPYRYIISHLDRAQAYGNKVDVLPSSMTNMPTHGTKTKGVGYITQPNQGYNRTLYSVISDGTKGANDGIDFYRGKGASIPLLRKPGQESRVYQGRAGSSNSSGVSNGAQAGTIETPRGVSDPQTGGSAMDEYNFGPNIENIKSYYNTLDFNYGAGPLAMVNPKLNELLT